MTNQKPLVFLSYAREDRVRVEAVYKQIANEGYRPWMDALDIRPGFQWEDEIRDAIRHADFFVLFLSNSATTKGGVLQKELRLAVSLASDNHGRKLHIILARLDDCELPLSFEHLSAVDLFRPGGWQEFMFGLDFRAFSDSSVSDAVAAIGVADRAVSRRRIFVAMPFSKDFEDIFFYGIQRAVDINGFECERIDRGAFVGDILSRIKERICDAAAVVADLSGGNPNVYLELGYAWGKSIPVILIAQNADDLHFDVRGHRCLEYKSIRALEESLAGELAGLKAHGTI